MKIKFISLVFFAFQATQSIFGQFVFKPKAGINISTLGSPTNSSFSTAESTTRPGIGFNVGLQVERKIWKNLFLASELSYSKKGVVDLTSSWHGTGASLTLDYVEVPLFVKWRIKEVFDISFGPGFSYLLNATYKSGPEKKQTTALYEKTDCSMNADLLYQTNKHLGIGLRYIHGSNKWNILPYEEREQIDPEITNNSNYFIDGRNKTFQIYFTYKL